MKILGIETVTKIGSLAVVENGNILGQVTIDIGLRHASGFVMSLDNLLSSLKLSLSKIDAIGIDIGPGSFTGIRVGIASALGLANPDEKPIVGICSLEVLSWQAKELTGKQNLIPVVDAKRDAFYSACYRFESGKIKLIKKPYAHKNENLSGFIPEDSFVFGPDMRKFSAIVGQKEGVIVDHDNTYPYAGMVAKIAEIKLKKGKIKKTIEPMYIHDIELNIKK
jgi:tRNA threonylcarbamoyl adenosine modification protein YeaZ